MNHKAFLHNVQKCLGPYLSALSLSHQIAKLQSVAVIISPKYTQSYSHTIHKVQRNKELVHAILPIRAQMIRRWQWWNSVRAYTLRRKWRSYYQSKRKTPCCVRSHHLSVTTASSEIAAELTHAVTLSVATVGNVPVTGKMGSETEFDTLIGVN